MSAAEPVLIERDGPVARLILNRPEAANAVDVSLARALMQAAIDCDEDPTVRCVVLTGAGKMFSAGGDLGVFAEAGDQAPRKLKEITAYFHVAVARLLRMEKPLLTVVNGPAAGAGLSLALLGDMVLASTSAHFTLGYGRVGLSPDGGATWLLPRLIGLRRTQELILSNRRVLAEEAQAIGMVTRLCRPDDDAPAAKGEDDRLTAQSRQAAAMLSQCSTTAWAQTRLLLLNSLGGALEAQLEDEARAISRCAGSSDFGEGLAAFKERRAPVFGQ